MAPLLRRQSASRTAFWQKSITLLSSSLRLIRAHRLSREILVPALGNPRPGTPSRGTVPRPGRSKILPLLPTKTAMPLRVMVLRLLTTAAAKKASPTRPQRLRAAAMPTVPNWATGATAPAQNLETRTVLNRAAREVAKPAIPPEVVSPPRPASRPALRASRNPRLSLPLPLVPATGAGKTAGGSLVIRRRLLRLVLAGADHVLPVSRNPGKKGLRALLPRVLIASRRNLSAGTWPGRYKSTPAPGETFRGTGPGGRRKSSVRR